MSLAKYFKMGTYCVWPNTWNDTCPIVFGTFLFYHACELRVWFQDLFHSLSNFKVSSLIIQPSLSKIITYFMQWALKNVYKCNHYWCKKGIYFHNFCCLNQGASKMAIHSLIMGHRIETLHHGCKKPHLDQMVIVWTL